jgi:hypothetical protein
VRIKLGFTRQEWQDCRELHGVSEEALEAAITQARAEAKAHRRHLTESSVFRILGIGRERRRNVGSADDIPEDYLTWAAELTTEQRRMVQLALKLTKPKR